jgi:hypothetical protein
LEYSTERVLHKIGRGGPTAVVIVCVSGFVSHPK